MKKKLLIAIGCIGLFAVLFFAFAPEPRTNAVIESGRRLINSPGQGCVDYTRKKLKDPSSIRLVEWHKINDNEILLKFKATNTYGAYLEGTQKCTVDSNGVNEASTQAQEVLDGLDKQIAEAQEKMNNRAVKP